MINSSSVPSYRRHRQSGQAVVTLPDGLGRRKDILLGKYGTAVSRHEYARVVGEWEANGRRLLQGRELEPDLPDSLVGGCFSFLQGTERKASAIRLSEVPNLRRGKRLTPTDSRSSLAVPARARL
jgi:hypothetical protein